MAALSVPVSPTASILQRDERLLISGVSWESYWAMRVALDDHASVRMTYLRGELEIMVTSPEHEHIKTILGRLLEVYALDRGLDINGYGETTFKSRAAERGLEADECYVLGGVLRDVPDLAIEVALTSGYIDKLDVYAGLRVPEVWFWRDGRIEVWRLAGERYESRARSELLPELDLESMTSFVSWPNQSAAVRAFRATLVRGA